MAFDASAETVNLGRRKTFAIPLNGEAPVNGGAERDRTDDLLLAKQALSQLSYSPESISGVAPGSRRVAKAVAAIDRKNGGPGKI